MLRAVNTEFPGLSLKDETTLEEYRMYTILIFAFILLTSSCASSIADRNRLDYQPAAIGPMMDDRAMRHDFLNRSNR